MKVLFISLGCDKNLVDSEFMLGKSSPFWIWHSTAPVETVKH